MNPLVISFIALLGIFMLCNVFCESNNISGHAIRLCLALRTGCLVTATLTLGVMTVLTIPPVLFIAIAYTSTFGILLVPSQRVKGGVA